MSDKRATYVLGAVAASLALVLGLITAVPASTINVTPSSLDVMGHAVIVLKDSDGYIKAYRQTDNIVPINGKDCAATRIFGDATANFCNDGAAVFDDIEIGTSSAALADTDTSLLDPITLDRTGNLIGGSPAVSGGSGSIKIIEGTFTLGGTETIAEVGLFDGPDVGDDMISRFLLTPAITAGFDDTVTITYVFEVG